MISLLMMDSQGVTTPINACRIEVVATDAGNGVIGGETRIKEKALSQRDFACVKFLDNDGGDWLVVTSNTSIGHCMGLYWWHCGPEAETKKNCKATPGCNHKPGK